MRIYAVSRQCSAFMVTLTGSDELDDVPLPQPELLRERVCIRADPGLAQPDLVHAKMLDVGGRHTCKFAEPVRLPFGLLVLFVACIVSGGMLSAGEGAEAQGSRAPRAAIRKQSPTGVVERVRHW